ncbi:DNA-directed RNA polymerase subunit alpha, partial [Candidatus Marinamargulisbacteria bacterium SCGC AG-439-L15]
LDASYSPIEVVNHRIEKVRVGRELDHDELVMDVYTNGSISAEQAIRNASGTLLDHLSLFGEMNRKPVDYESEEDVDPLQKKKESAMALTVEDLELSARSLNCLKKASIQTVAELVAKDMSELIKIKNFGKKSAEEINEKLKQYGLQLKSIEMVETL